MTANNNKLDIADKVCYFAYGSNMRSSVMERRGMKLFAVKRLVVHSHVLTFDIFGVPYNEPAMASIAERGAVAEFDRGTESPPAVHGVGYVLSAGDFEKLLISEGAGTAYLEVELEAHLLAGDGEGADESTDPIPVRTLVGRYPFRPNALPSQRYLRLLIDGAEEHKLPQSYQRYLATLPSYAKSLSKVESFGARLFLGFWMPVIVWTMTRIKTGARSTGSDRSNGSGLVVWLLFNAVWLHYDFFHCWIWGHGGGRR
ncbi:hypothetical protein P153DRAFT_341843 [Dothidotthia symphoricarpi CBS 119687]|uniref:gamma-glutamylcyclotransferase n=1 Tax=Dothidotthia symphoricarpi CBS 119687 TaxID=1392245 RepID=A0A6A6ABA6_9PLEO|nr:uncharacterized protein P153DRAFT_341843 [Dothidotthia symphoricarpi CBS 119687]KAF2128304.1 hypothetical protein P153DRAFT_341843 [Dothidotthia symphoricarpi CBS 119687]